MTIRFQAEIDDPDTEALLAWLEKRYADSSARKLWVLRTAEKWLELQAPHKAMSVEKSKASLQVESSLEVL